MSESPHALDDPAATLRRRLQPRATHWLDIESGLEHFALINYALPAARLRPHVPQRFELATVEIDGERRAMMSVVPFVDADFHFRHLLPFVRFRFCQTNYRVYVIDRTTGEHVVWFFGTTLGSWTVWPARWLWRIPWYPARYQVACEYDGAARRYRRFRYRATSAWGDARVELADTGEPVRAPLPGFASFDDMVLVLTHPVDGYFYRLDGAVGTYSVSHDVLELTHATPVDLRFGLFERLGLLSADEMMRPHSIFLCPRTVFQIHMPPRRCR